MTISDRDHLLRALAAIAFLLAFSNVDAGVFPQRFDLSNFTEADGVILTGIELNSNAGAHARAAGDFNGDGIDDIVIGSSEVEQGFAGAAFVVYGSNSPPANIELASLNGANGFLMRGGDGDDLGEQVAGLGDINGDGYDDIGVGARNKDVLQREAPGVVHVIFGGPNVAPSGELDPDALDGSNGFVVNGFFPGGDASMVSAAGDVNADGFPDIAIGAFGVDTPTKGNVGQAYLVFGGPEVGSSGVINVLTLNGSNGVILEGQEADDFTGRDTAGIGDINDDGIDDVLIGAFSVDFGELADVGGGYVLYGSSDPWPDRIALGELLPTQGYFFGCIGAGFDCGAGVDGLGDVNADGHPDFIVSGSRAQPDGVLDVGEAYVVFGGGTIGSDGDARTSELNGNNGFTIQGIDREDFFGRPSSTAGDINGDGIPDIVIGANMAEPEDGIDNGEVYVIYGKAGVGSSGRLLAEELDGDNGFTLEGADVGSALGASATTAGDFNADGLDDLMIGAPFEIAKGQVYILFGRDGNRDIDDDGVSDVDDNCIERSNADQRDSNGDGYGNVCDADLTDDCVVNIQDWLAMRTVFGTDDADADLDGDGIVNIDDARALFGDRLSPPGPSGLTEVCQ
ncbi:MAG: hypothetical protein AAGA68_22760 [Pseudomonadota bacterium]